jgi:MFS family permease
MEEVGTEDLCDSTTGRDLGRSELATGWPVLLAATLGCGAGLSSLPFYSLGTFIALLQQEFGWARGEISAAFLYLTLTLALTAPALGWLLDRIGPRKIAMVAIPCFAAVLFAISRFDGPLTAFHSLFAIAALAGGGTCPILYTRAVNAQFNRMRGLALGITLGGMGVVAIVLRHCSRSSSPSMAGGPAICCWPASPWCPGSSW